MRLVTSILRNKTAGITVFKTESLTDNTLKFYEVPRFVGSDTIKQVHEELQSQMFTGVGDYVAIPEDEVDSKIATYMKQEGWEQCDLY